MMTPRSKCLHPAVASFVANLSRVATFAAMPAELSFTVRRDQLLSDCATFNTSGKLEPDVRQFLGKEPSPEYKAEFNKLANKHLSEDYRKRREETKEIGVGYIERVLDVEFPPMMKSMDAIFEAVILQSWTSFECLAGDLWFTSLDNGPSEWRTNTLKKSTEFKRGSNWEPTSRMPSQPSDPQASFGSALRDQDKIGFQTFRSIKFWYKSAMGDEAEKIFLTNDGYLRGLAAVRNLIVHQASIADATYLDEVRKFPDLQTQEKTRLSLDGKIVHKLMDAAGGVGISLIRFIDDRLTPVSS